jgi:hypothetical protein
MPTPNLSKSGGNAKTGISSPFLVFKTHLIFSALKKTSLSVLNSHQFTEVLSHHEDASMAWTEIPHFLAPKSVCVEKTIISS